jgi:biopolymer transport protein ExbD
VKGKKQVESAPSSLMLRVDIGNPEVIGNGSEGIELWSRNTPPLDRDEKNHLIEHEVAVEIPRDGEYVVNGKPVGKSALVSALRARLKEAEVAGKTVSVILEENSQISYASLAEVANAAFVAQAERIKLRTPGP